jgi:hypothetical protein
MACPTRAIVRASRIEPEEDRTMKTLGCRLSTMLSVMLLATACGEPLPPPVSEAPERDSIAGAWRSQVRFASGELAEMKDLEFMYAFNAGGTLTESSNYDGVPPVPPAYGVWKKSGPREFEAKYQFYMTKPPATLEEITKGGGWLPSGYGVLTERFTLSEDGKSYRSTIAYAQFDQAGKPVEGGGTGTGVGSRMNF